MFWSNVPTPRRKILALGDSLTLGEGATSISQSWPVVLGHSFGDECPPVWNFGVGGETSTQIKARALVRVGYSDGAATIIIAAGRNNFTQPATVKADIAAMVAYFNTTRFLVLSILNSDAANEYAGQANYDTLVGLNADLATLYGERYVETREPLVAAYNPAIPQDVIDHGRDIPPSSLRSDTIHLLDAGYAIIAAQVRARYDALGF